MRIVFLVLIASCAETQAKIPSEELIDLMHFKPKDVTKTSIIQEHSTLKDDFYHPEDPSRGHLVQLAYITPWNNHGYDLAKKTAHKLSHISPVWFQAKPVIHNGVLDTCKIEGTHDIDRGWIEELYEKNANIKIVPRILFDGWNAKEMEQFLVNTQATLRCSKVIAAFYQRNQFDGTVVELYMQALMALQSLEAKTYIVEAMEQLAKILRKAELQVIYTVPAPLEWNSQPNQLVDPEEYIKLIEAANYVQIMTYDYRGKKPTGVSPYDWIEDCLYYLTGGRSPKTLVGINWYGYEFTNGNIEPITANKYLEILQSDDSVLKFDEEPMEHSLKTKSSIIYYPSISSLELRMNLAHRNDAGVAIWDYGQGLDYFSNLLS